MKQKRWLLKQACIGAAMLAACAAQASELKLYLSQPVRDAASGGNAVPDGALPWPASYGQSYTMETFNTETIGTKTAGNWAVGSYLVNGSSTTNVSGPNIYGGAGTGSTMGGGGSNFLNAGTTGSPAGVTITLTDPARYVGFWWSAGSGGNNMQLLDQDDNVLVSMDTAGLMAFLNAPANTTMTALDGTTTYARPQYNGNPFTGTPGAGGEPFAYLNFVLNDTTGAGSTVIKKIRFWGGGFELDNVAVREAAVTTPLPPSWVDTGITQEFVDPPVTAPDSGTTRTGVPSAPLNLLTNDPYVPAGGTAMAQATSANGGTITGGPIQWVYTPPAGFSGTDTFDYTVCLAPPDQAKCSTSTVTMTVVAPDVVIDLTGLPPTATVGVPYNGTFTCTNNGSADALDGTSCTATGLPPGVTVTSGACTISPSAAPWAAGNAIPVGQTVTCPVAGTPENNKGPKTVTGTTGATDDSNTGNNTTTKEITVVGVPHVVIDLGGLPPTGTVNVPYSGSFTCKNDGTADAPNAACTATGLPPGVTLGACTITPGPTAWTSAATIPEGETVTCQVSGTPTTTGTTTVSGTGGTSTVTRDVAIGAVPPTPVPTLTQWGQVLMAGLLVLLGWAALRRRTD